MHTRNIRALVLKNIKYKDNDKIYTLFARDEGKISVIGKGVSKITSKRAGSLDSLNEVQAQISDHISGQYYLNEVKVINSFRHIKSNYKILANALYTAELINKLILEDSNVKHIYDLMIAFYKRMDRESYKADGVFTNKFELKLMQLLGYEPPKNVVLAWKNSIKDKRFDKADNIVKRFVKDIIGERIKSLEL
ncbi:DNA repair protein RecO [candidate division WWE3 bacterium RBG_19FT_COMBO_34_6]|uniref:DNA repair protein RecO n=1 Tax=candidate division WWE3 bacterium RBG_19FT_COMBO_34_6 TaxID=1802612 RepID=A0A1F4UN33_UNCKA|nr:MAG: DNA repair protein RecO [candidate division WWE3 bacterium RBG_19FT_COMBO_34_6]